MFDNTLISFKHDKKNIVDHKVFMFIGKTNILII